MPYRPINHLRPIGWLTLGLTLAAGMAQAAPEITRAEGGSHIGDATSSDGIEAADAIAGGQQETVESARLEGAEATACPTEGIARAPAPGEASDEPEAPEAARPSQVAEEPITDAADSASSGEAVAPQPPLSCEAAVRRALHRHPGPAAAEALALAVRAESGQDERLPQLRLRGGVRSLTEGGRVGFRVPLPGLGVSAARAEIDRTRLALAHSDTLTVRLDLAEAVRRLHLAVRRARAESSAARARLTIASDAAAYAALRHKAGQTPRLAVTAADLAEVEARDALTRARQEEARLAAALAALVGAQAGPGRCADDVYTGLAAADHRARAEAEHMRAEATLADRRRWMAPEHVELSWDADPGQSDRVMISVAVQLPGLAIGRDPEGARNRAARAHLEAARYASSRRVEQAERVLVDARQRATELDDGAIRADAAEQLAAVHPTRQGMPAVVSLRRALLTANARRISAAFAVEEAAIALLRAQDGAEPQPERW